MPHDVFHVLIHSYKDMDKAVKFVMEVKGWGPAAAKGLVKEVSDSRPIMVAAYQSRNEFDRIRRAASRYEVIVDKINA